MHSARARCRAATGSPRSPGPRVQPREFDELTGYCAYVRPSSAVTVSSPVQGPVLLGPTAAGVSVADEPAPSDEAPPAASAATIATTTTPSAMAGPSLISAASRVRPSSVQRVDHAPRGAFQVIPQDRLVHRREVQRLDRLPHVRQPAVPGVGVHPERGVAHPQPRVPALLAVRRRPAPVLLQEHPEPPRGGLEVLVGVQPPQHGVAGAALEDPADEPHERVVPADLLVEAALLPQRALHG